MATYESWEDRLVDMRLSQEEATLFEELVLDKNVDENIALDRILQARLDLEDDGA